jgi:hypothetical protein
MTTALTTARHPTDPKTGLTLPLSKSLASPDLDKHRAMVAVELEVMAKKMDRFGWDRDRGSMAHDRLIADWMDTLQDYPLTEVRAACRAWVQDNPRRMPNEGDIRSKILAARSKHVAALPKPAEAETQTERVSADRAAEIMAEAGFRPKRFGGDA